MYYLVIRKEAVKMRKKKANQAQVCSLLLVCKQYIRTMWLRPVLKSHMIIESESGKG